MTLTNPVLRHSRVALAAAGALVGVLAATAGSAHAQQAYRGMPGYQSPAYTPAPAYQTPPAYAPPAAYQPAPGYQPQFADQAPPAYPPVTAYRTVEQIVVVAPGVHRRTVGRSASGIPIEELSLSRTVDISDLNLSRWEDLQMLDDRVRTAAFRACNALNRQYPPSLYPSDPSDDDGCVARATNDGLAQARTAVAQANAYAAAYPR